MVACKIFIEGGGDSRDLHIACREGFNAFFSKVGIPAYPPILPIACGGRRQAYQDFCRAIRNQENALLLVDSEDPVIAAHLDNPWQHLAERKGDKWQQPPHTTEDHCHLMVQCMESWFLTDVSTLEIFFGKNFAASALPDTADVESLPKEAILTGLALATVQCTKIGQYRKGRHSFKILAQIDPDKVCAASSWAKRFIGRIEKVVELSHSQTSNT